MLVHVGGAGDPILLTMSDNSKELMLIADVYFSEVFDVASLLVFPDFEIVLAYIQQVPNFLHVELENRYF